MNYEEMRRVSERARRKQVWAERIGTLRWVGLMVEFVVTMTLLGAFIGWLVVGCVNLVHGAELVTDTEVEQARWLHVYNECRHELSLKGHKVAHAVEVCNSVADIDIEAN